jgi:hypothetical protein
LPANDYHLISHWRVPGAILDVYDILTDAQAFPRWWPSVYLDVLEIQSGGPDKVDKVVRLETKAWLPYKLNWHFTLSDADPPNTFSLKAWGDFEGTGRWTLEQDGGFVDATYDWRITARKPLLRYGSLLLRPLFVWNHRWAMAKGEQSLALELRRRSAATEAERRALPPPPQPIAMPSTPLLVGLGVLLAVVVVRNRRRR